MLALKAASLARGHSGVREDVVDTLLAVHNAGLVPYVPAQGSVGASGDLAPLAHMTLALLGEGEMLVDGRRRPALAALQSAGIAAAEAAGQGRPGADQRHADLHRAGAACAVRLRAGAGVGAGGRRADGGCGARQRRPLRPAHPRAARPAGADRRGAVLPRAAGRQRRSACPMSSGDDRVQDPYCAALPAAGGGRLPGPAAPCGAACCCARPMPSPTTRWSSRPKASAGDDDLRRQLPRRAGGAGRRRHGAGHRRGRRDRRAAHRHADRHAACRGCRPS